MKSIISKLENELEAKEDYQFEGVSLKKNIESLAPLQSIDAADATSKTIAFKPIASKAILFIDGGEGLIFQSASLCVFRVRIAGVIFSGLEKKKTFLKELSFFASRKQGFSMACTEKIPELGFDIFSGLDKEDFSVLPETVRKRLEAFYAVQWAVISDDPYSAVAAVVFDGLLQSSNPDNSDSIVQKLHKKLLHSEGNALALIGIAKTSSAVCDDGTSVVAAMRQIARKPSFVILKRKVAGVHSCLCVVKLHEKAACAFVAEFSFYGAGTAAESAVAERESALEFFPLLAALSVDVSFLGYPYPLVLVDQLARISLEEVAAEKTRLLVSLSRTGSADSLKAESFSKEAHSVLDRMRF